VDWPQQRIRFRRDDREGVKLLKKNASRLPLPRCGIIGETRLAKKSVSFSEKEDLRRHEVLTEPERKLDFALLENCVPKKPADFCKNTSIENTQSYTRHRNGKLSWGRNAKGRRCQTPTPLI
jgi:hypothetical protein